MHPRTNRNPFPCASILGSLAWLLVPGLAGCATDKARDITPAVVDSGLEELTKPESEQRLRELLALVEVRTSARELAHGVIEAGLEEMKDPAVRDSLLDFGQELATRLAEVAHAGKDESPAAVIGATLEALDSDENRARFQRIVTNGNARGLSAELAAGLVEGGARALADEATAARLATASEQAAGAAAHALARGIETEIGPALRVQFAALAADASRAAFDEESKARASAFAGSVSAAVVRSATQAFAHELQHVVAPVMQSTLDASARDLSRQAALGVSDALKTELGPTLLHMQEESLRGLRGSLAEDKAAAERWLRIVGAGAAVLGAALVLLGYLYYQDRKAWRARVTERNG